MMDFMESTRLDRDSKGTSWINFSRLPNGLAVSRLFSQSHRSRTRSFLPFPNLVVNHLAFAKVVEGYVFDLRMVEEQVALSGLNKAETSICNQPLYLSLWHDLPP